MARTFGYWMFVVVTMFGWMAFFMQSEELRAAELERDEAERRLGACIDIAADARDESLMLEDMWLRAGEDAMFCQNSESWVAGVCVGSEYWTSHDWMGP